MRASVLVAALLFSSGVAASGPEDFARQWPVLGSCQGDAPTAPAVPGKQVDCDGVFALTLDESVYRQVTRADLSDMAAYNGDGEALPFGPMPASYSPPPAAWRDAAWFVLPPARAGAPTDLHLHVTRSGEGDLNLDASLSHDQQDGVEDLLIDVRAGDRQVDAIELEFAFDATDFSAQVDIDASDDLQNWRTVVGSATVAQLRQGEQMLVRRHLEFSPVSAAYLRLHVLGAGAGIPVKSVRLQVLPASASSENLKRSLIAADFVRRDGRAYVYLLPARVPVERLNIILGDDNAVANFSVSAREPGDRNWTYVGQMNAFRLRGAGVALDNEAMDVQANRRREWRIEPSIDLVRTPILQFSYRPESWLLLTRGSPPFVIAAGSTTVRRGEFPLDALVMQVRARYGKDWQPTPASLGVMQMAGGEAALSAFTPGHRRTWLLWAVLVLGALAIIVMVMRLLRAPPEP